MNQVRYLQPSISAPPTQTQPEVERRCASGLSLCGGNYPSVEVVTFAFFCRSRSPSSDPSNSNVVCRHRVWFGQLSAG